MKLSPATQTFILHWGEMGTRWGINRTVAQIHALLFLSPHPLPAEDISDSLAIARSTVSAGLRELQSWGLIHTVPVLGDRREHFASLSDVWGMFRVVMDGRKKREMDPTLRILQQTVRDLEAAKKEDPYTRKKLTEMADFFETMIQLYEQIQQLPTDSLRRLSKTANLLSKLTRLAS